MPSRLSLLALLAAGTSAAPTVPRVELHVHLDGSISTDLLYEVATKRNLTLPQIGRPAESVEDLRQLLQGIEGWHRFDVVNDIVGGDTATIAYIAERFVDFQADSGVWYTEVRYDPVRLTRSAYANSSIPIEDAVAAVEAGLSAGAERRGVAVHQIHCAMRGQSAEACFQAAALAAKLRSERVGGVVGLDLAGDEKDFPNDHYTGCIRHAKEVLGLRVTVHAGEGTTAEEVRSAIVDMKADRIGHGYSSAGDPRVLNLLRAHRIHVEACPRSARSIGLLDAVGTYKRAGVSFGISTDDPADIFQSGNLEANEVLLKENLNFTDDDVQLARHHAITAAFAPASAKAAVARGAAVLGLAPQDFLV